MKHCMLALTVLVFGMLLPPAHVSAAPRCFPEAAPAISDCIDGRIAEFWQRQGGLPVFGYPLTPEQELQTESGPIRVQLFERARLELHPENPPPYDVLLGRLGADALARAGTAAPAPQAAQDGCLFFAQSGQNICPPFLQTWRRYGLDLGQPGVSEAESLALFGLPLTAPRSETLGDGRTYTVQWFERARFEDHGGQGVLLGLLGRELGQGESAPNNPGTGLSPGGFLLASGNQLTRLGQPVQLKGVNYYPQWRPWAEMWSAWDATQTAREWKLARDELGINVVRVLIPYSVSGKNSDEGRINERLLSQLRELAQIAGDLDMRLIVALFDFYNSFPAPGTREEEHNFAYLRTLLGNFAGDERIIAWDLHNEPDNYPYWKEGNAPAVLTWLGRMADEVHRVAPNQLVTVGMGQYDNLWQPGPDGRRVIDYSDLVSVHIYNAPDAVRQLEELRGYSDKPILLGEFGWPTGPRCAVRDYNEAQQRIVYEQMLAAAQGRTVGVVAWSLRDYDAGPTKRWETREEHYGLYRPDGSLKPAAEPFRAYVAAPLPSITKTSLPLSSDNPQFAGGKMGSILIPESGHYVKGPFRMAWELLGGRGSFGLPISEAFVRADDGRVVQYFEAAALELRPGAETEPGFDLLDEVEQTRRRVTPINLGSTYVAGRGFAESEYSVDSQFKDFYDGISGRWRLGRPISPLLSEEIGGVPTPVQYFERGSLQWNAAAGVVELGRLGSWAWDIQCTYVR